MPPVGFETTMSAGERPQTYTLDRAATGTGRLHHLIQYYDKVFPRDVPSLKAVLIQFEDTRMR